MSWRTVVIANRCKLDYELGCMVVRGESTKRLYLDEIAVLMIESTAVAMDRFFKDVLGKKLRLLLLESTSRRMLENKRRWTVDRDLCEF
ncbi:MAG: hypothetical protein IJM20_07370 [Clostridia bacterium]|nr:hypothetical protein [Clostridia bacterium]